MNLPIYQINGMQTEQGLVPIESDGNNPGQSGTQGKGVQGAYGIQGGDWIQITNGIQGDGGDDA